MASAFIPKTNNLNPNHFTNYVTGNTSKHINQPATSGYRYITFRISSYTKTELKGLKNRLISDLKRVQILRQFVGSVPVNKNNYYYSPEPTLQTATVPSLTGLKRKVSVSVSAAVRDGKRQCGGRGNGRVSNASKRKVIMRECGKILGKLMKDKNGWVFNKPVDVVGLKLFDYYNVIEKPMDLGTINGKIGKNEYKSPREFAEDVRLTFENAMVYNGKGSSVFGMAERLLVMFEGLFCSAYPKFAKNGSVLVGKRVEKAVLNRTVVVESGIEAEVPVVSKKLGGGDIGKPIIRTIRTGNRREMTEEEKAELAASFLNLNLGQEGMHQIMAIVKKGAGLEREGDEIELDLGVLDNETLWELHSFIGRTLGNKGGTGCNVNGVVNELNGSVQTDSCRERDAGEEYVDIGEEMQLTNYPSVVIEKDVVNGSDSGSDSSSDSDTSSSDSGSGTSYNEHEVNSTPKGVVP